METTTEKKPGMSTALIIGLVVVVIFIIGIGYYAVTKLMPAPSAPSPASGGSRTPGSGADTTSTTPQSSSGGPLVSEAAKNKRHLSNYAKWNDYLAGTTRQDTEPAKVAAWKKYDAYWGAIASSVESNPDNTANDEGYVTGFMKGMDLDQSAYNVVQFKNEIKEYVANPDRLGHWAVQQGEFLK